jgi:outer membrane protein TolC
VNRKTIKLHLLYFSVTICFLLLWISTGTSLSQTDTLTLDKAIELALKNNRIITIAEVGVKQSESHLREVNASRFPSIFFRSHYLLAPEIGYNEIVTNGGEYGAQITATLPLYDGGVRNAVIDQSVNNNERSSINLQKNKNEIAFTVRIFYYDILQAREELSIRQETVERLQDYVSFLTRMRLGGSATESDVLKAQVDLNNATTEADVAQQSLRKAKLLLNNAIGNSLSRNIEVIPINSEDTSHVIVFSAEKNLDIQLLEHDKISSTYDVSIAQGERLPTVTISGDVGALGVQPNEFRHDIGYSLFLSLDLPLFTWGGIDNRIQQKEFAEQQLDAQIQLQRRELETEWRVTLSDLETARKNMASYTSTIATAEQNYLSAKSRFAGGAGSNLEVLDAQRLLVEAKLNYNNALFQLRSDLATILKFSGQQ